MSGAAMTSETTTIPKRTRKLVGVASTAREPLLEVRLAAGDFRAEEEADLKWSATADDDDGDQREDEEREGAGDAWPMSAETGVSTKPVRRSV